MDNPNTPISTDRSIADSARALEDYFAGQSGAIIAYSGGADSGLLAYAAHRVLAGRMVAVLADSPSLARREYRHAVEFAQEHGIPLKIVHTTELVDPRYRENTGNRCYYCKKALFGSLMDLRKELSAAFSDTDWPIFFGMNRDDLGDHRPGHRAAQEAGIAAPYVELGFDKATIRSVCRHYGLELSDKPAMPCISSRIAYGEPINAEKLSQVERAEDFLNGLGLRIFRVRHHGQTARIEVPPEDFDTILHHREKIRRHLQALGFTYVCLDLDGFKSGSLNAVLKGNGRQ